MTIKATKSPLHRIQCIQYRVQNYSVYVESGECDLLSRMKPTNKNTNRNQPQDDLDKDFKATVIFMLNEMKKNTLITKTMQ